MKKKIIKNWCNNSDENIFKRLLFGNTFRGFTLSLFGVFFPIFLLQQGISLKFIIIYYLSYHILGSIFVYPFMLGISKIGIQKSFILSYIFSVPFYFMLYFIEDLSLKFGLIYFLGTLLVFNKLSDTIYWYSYHLAFSECSNVKTMGGHLGKVESFGTMILLFSPVAGAALIKFFSYNLVFVVIVLLLFFSLLPLMILKYPKVPVKLKKKDVFSLNFLKKNKVFFVDGIYSKISGFLWPVYLYFMNFQLIALGFFSSMIKFVNSVSMYLLGFVVGKDKKKDNLISKSGLFILGIGVTLQGLLKSSFGLFSAQNISALGHPFFNMPIIENMYERSEKKPVLAIMGRELFLNLGRACMFLIILIFVLIFGIENFSHLFVTIGGILIFISLIRKIVFVYAIKE